MADTKRLYTGPTMMAKGLAARLQEIGISPIFRNDHDSSLMAGFTASIPNQSMLFVRPDQWDDAYIILKQFIQELEEEF